MKTIFKNGNKELYLLLERLNASDLVTQEVRQPWAEQSKLMIACTLPSQWTKEQVVQSYNNSQQYAKHPKSIIEE